MLLACWNIQPSGCLGSGVVQLGLWLLGSALVQLASRLVGILLHFVQLGPSLVTMYLAWSWLIHAS